MKVRNDESPNFLLTVIAYISEQAPPRPPLPQGEQPPFRPPPPETDDEDEVFRKIPHPSQPIMVKNLKSNYNTTLYNTQEAHNDCILGCSPWFTSRSTTMVIQR